MAVACVHASHTGKQSSSISSGLCATSDPPLINASKAAALAAASAPSQPPPPPPPPPQMPKMGKAPPSWKGPPPPGAQVLACMLFHSVGMHVLAIYISSARKG
eukprot:1157822-Pelagomonas_calceolata.AAC.16